ncbi:hypothetical protein BLOT_014583, partial [Blomia tropicalis]
IQVNRQIDSAEEPFGIVHIDTIKQNNIGNRQSTHSVVLCGRRHQRQQLDLTLSTIGIDNCKKKVNYLSKHILEPQL